ncbi:hypothetical protein ERD78_06420 [Allopusillimonas soli]|uniref:Uncharacterized protein n=1 Tax=Allopusillimonas soli TaxID=659016 RepID=A0A853F8S9_9BURK|nr:DUF4286 family protein [Allopusillimonas soli]NYT36503.1 hypothetical protein [Allopusillimonas soli]TEA75006.1 hypothetical protein ERD78_06420 [Allopusillimonas soli]
MGRLLGAGALALWLNVASELDDETDAWYVTEHLPDRVNIGGYLRARRYQSIDGAREYLTLFEAKTVDDLASEGYLGLVSRISAQSQRIRAGFSGVVRNTFRVISSQGEGTGGVISSWRVAPRDIARQMEMQEIAQWMQEVAAHDSVAAVHWLQAQPQVRARMDSVRAVGKDDAFAETVLLVEATRASVLQSLREHVLSPAQMYQHGWREEAYGLYALMYSISGADRKHNKLGDTS